MQIEIPIILILEVVHFVTIKINKEFAAENQIERYSLLLGLDLGIGCHFEIKNIILLNFGELLLEVRVLFALDYDVNIFECWLIQYVFEHWLLFTN